MQLFGQTSNLPSGKPHTVESITAELESAALDIEAEIRKMDEEAEKVLEEIEGTVDGLSDLRYGKLPDADLGREVLDRLKRIESICDR
jgi:centromere-localized protein 2